ncbi:Cysteine--tRNA ligase [uncultured Desulfovibrio sp.]|uniref:Cysteine--tRNA ligase n=1 Tax=uncultured Desulfovibrio sp. TaxID=167968 RepID=A0A212KKA4_9BACT|nr:MULTISPECIES: cysteine--tRNA ligase [Desulfovibrio]MCB6541029.1 cysteine--tRNA ligase [Desulfovibrio desulfuricans]MCB6552111.1 cysteine--tRNA ligase [Desulfovibrio desulfuricans]MCB6563954.1 cysteine--tRNA ligase [Desulfovibrio desulfuricans]MCB7345033.1 cysteine--tRNA ligase [Desulfovibrio desulfuricans]MCQ4859902.1 cysteine--tRNA ligase [Desulfovibrio desulfuricans]
MLLYNTLGRKKEEFVPVHPGKANMYVCGITAYDLCHIGHARSALVFDVLVRQLRHTGLEVRFVRNFTDVDDKIINRANKEGRDWREVAQTYITAFHEDMDRLGVLRADEEPRATDFIPQIQAICSTLVDSGKAYSTPSGDVYFRVRAYEPYGKLSGRSLDDLLSGARVAPGEEKEDPLDFALWKAAKPGEPFWESPWGKGRPGWHIECSAMSQPYLPLDIHGGGQDLIFPHHENEIAQSEAACACSLARYWVHNGFVQVNAEKMSKSLGNFKTIRDILENYLPETLRFFLLGKHYRSPIDFTADSMDEAEKAQHRVYTALHEAGKALARDKWKKTPLPQEMAEEWAALPKAFDAALEDDINTAQALGQVFAQVRLVNRLLEDKALRSAEAGRDLLQEFLARAQEWDKRLGLFGQAPQTFLADLRGQRATRGKIDVARVEELMLARQEARASKDFARSDSLRQEILDLGVSVRDTPEGQVWDLE